MAVLSGYGSRVIGPYSPKMMSDGTATALIQTDIRATGGTGALGVAAGSTTALISIEPFTSLGNHYFLLTYTV
jgi:hypothetical protein|tara:strand:+ start:11188 stop:11406 length:219 start_codon:yes stop_codon:yes gene_type:complete